jgi:hypothetical protein
MTYAIGKCGAGGRRTVTCLALLVAAIALTFGDDMHAKPFNPPQSRSLASFGAMGDGKADDTAALASALTNSDQFCLDGQNRTYRVSGTLRVSKSLCLRNVRLVQSTPPFDTSPYMGYPCDISQEPSAKWDCGSPVVKAADLPALRAFLNLRTLYIMPPNRIGTLKVNLRNVSIDRGPLSFAGSPDGSAGVWIDSVDSADLDRVEITGGGKGFGLLISNSRNVRITKLSVHDLIWSPYPGERQMGRADIQTVGWNNTKLHEFVSAESSPHGQSKFYTTRVREQLTCVAIQTSSNVTIRRSKVSNCVARLVDGILPWQTDGINIGSSVTNIAITDGTSVSSTWEGLDIVAGGTGVSDLLVDGLTVTDSFGYGIKIGYKTRHVRVIDPQVRRAGIAGIVISGPASDILVKGGNIRDVGIVRDRETVFEPWPTNIRSGIHLDSGTDGTNNIRREPNGVTIQNVSVDTSQGDSHYEVGFRNSGATRTRLITSHARNFRVNASKGF